MKIAVEGCAHGELDNIYDTIKSLEERENIKIDLLICCGDFQAVRNEEDLRCMAVPPKYYNMCSFYKYYNGEKIAPLLTIFIGGNHEASNHLQELPFGGWVAPNIYFMGYAGVVNIGGVRIAGVSGIYKCHDYTKGHFELAPYPEDAKRSVYHIRNVDVFRLKQLTRPIDICISHDWPADITKHGNEKQLLDFKPFLRADVESGKLGNPPCRDLLNLLKPKYWFSAHMHCKFAALVQHDDKSATKFLALDKCLPKRRFLQVLDLVGESNVDIDNISISYDIQWLAILMLTNHLTSIKQSTQYMPGLGGNERWKFVPTEEEKELVLSKFKSDLRIPENFTRTASTHIPNSQRKEFKQPSAKLNPQTIEFCKTLGVDDPGALILEQKGALNTSITDSAICSDHQLVVESEISSFIQDTDLSFDGSLDTSLSLKRQSLSLPDPNNGSTNDDLEISEGNLSLNNLSDIIQLNSHESETSSSMIINPVGSPIVKKLKRRNIDIYQSQNDEQ